MGSHTSPNLHFAPSEGNAVSVESNKMLSLQSVLSPSAARRAACRLSERCIRARNKRAVDWQPGSAHFRCYFLGVGTLLVRGSGLATDVCSELTPCVKDIEVLVHEFPKPQGRLKRLGIAPIPSGLLGYSPTLIVLCLRWVYSSSHVRVSS